MVSLLVSFTLTPMLSARWLKRAAEARARPRARVEGLAVLPCPSTRATRGCSNGRWPTGASSPGLALLVLAGERAALHRSPTRTSCRNDDQSEFEVERARARGHQPGVDRGHRQPRGPRRFASALPEVEYTLVTVGGRRGAGRRIGQRVRAPEAARPARARDQFALMDERARQDAAGGCSATACAPASGRCRDRRRRQPERRHPVRRSTGRISTGSRRTPRRLSRRRGRSPATVDVDTSLNAGKPEMTVGSIAPRPPTSACRSPTPPTRCACWSAATR